ncbi:MAG: hypothetical protein ACTXOO_00790 [Sodalis sp. (in: enterobacteria)]
MRLLGGSKPTQGLTKITPQFRTAVADSAYASSRDRLKIRTAFTPSVDLARSGQCPTRAKLP